jgi:hypothetical protein
MSDRAHQLNMPERRTQQHKKMANRRKRARGQWTRRKPTQKMLKQRDGQALTSNLDVAAAPELH